MCTSTHYRAFQACPNLWDQGIVAHAQMGIKGLLKGACFPAADREQRVGYIARIVNPGLSSGRERHPHP